MIEEKSKWSRISLRYCVVEPVWCTTTSCYLKKGVVVLRAYDEEDKEFYFGPKCQSCMAEWLKEFNMSFRDLEDSDAF